MKAGVITHYDVHNHGAHLQMFALIQVLKDLGFDEVKALRYRKNYDFMGADKIESKYNFGINSIPLYTRYLFRKGIRRTIFNYNKRKLLKEFRDKYDLVGEYYSEATNLDLLVIGSDEIFSLESGLNPCFFGFGIQCKKIISYAASFGPTTLKYIANHNSEKFVKSGLENIGFLSVRDENSMNIVENYLNKKVPIVCDPVILYEFNNYFNRYKINKYRDTIPDKYCIVYSYDDNMNDFECVKSIKDYAKKRRLVVISIGYYHSWCDRNIQSSPLELFKWFSGAEMVFTDTFHGCVLSLVCNTQFWVKLRNNQNKLTYLLAEYDLQKSRLIENFNSLCDFDSSPIDYVKINFLLNEKRSSSLKYLKKALSYEF